MTTTRWASADLPDLSGRTAVLTGGSGGLASVRRFDDGWTGPLDVLINHAGIEAVPKALMADAFDTGNRMLDIAMLPVRLVAQDAAHEALPTLFAATEDLPGGSFVGPDKRMSTRRFPAFAELIAAAADPELARELWDLSAGLTGVDDRSRVTA